MVVELINVIRTLDSNIAVLEAEVHEIAGDMQVLRALNRKYGAFWDVPMMQLKALKVDKCSTIKDIKRQLAMFERQMGPAKALCEKLAKSRPLKISPVAQQPPPVDLIVSVVSPILANSQSIDAPPSQSIVFMNSEQGSDRILVQHSPNKSPISHPDILDVTINSSQHKSARLSAAPTHLARTAGRPDSWPSMAPSLLSASKS
mmetsp:Transcript_4271/g.7482  ORF Transcript_4271/g.7482 Transcript_4271/m.7482 type:complete len:203 (-) Transcript_4271:74-682(-)